VQGGGAGAEEQLQGVGVSESQGGDAVANGQSAGAQECLEHGDGGVGEGKKKRKKDKKRGQPEQDGSKDEEAGQNKKKKAKKNKLEAAAS